MRQVRVHILDPMGGVNISEIDDPDDLFQMIELGKNKRYRVEQWIIGRDLTVEQANKWKDPKTGDIYMIVAYQDGKASSFAVSKSIWDQGKEKLDNARLA